MSYCRVIPLVSDVYVFGTGTHIECYLEEEVAQKMNMSVAFRVETTRDSTAEKAMLGHLMYLRDVGLRVPGTATRRLLGEISYKDDIAYIDEEEKEDISDE